MWASLKLVVMLVVILLVMAIFSNNFVHFAIFGELSWLGVYVGCAVGGTYVDDTYLYSMPFLILLLTAVEATVLWSFILLNRG